MREGSEGVGRGNAYRASQGALQRAQAWSGCPGPVPSLLASPGSSLVRGLDLETSL